MFTISSELSACGDQDFGQQSDGRIALVSSSPMQFFGQACAGTFYQNNASYEILTIVPLYEDNNYGGELVAEGNETTILEFDEIKFGVISAPSIVKAKLIIGKNVVVKVKSGTMGNGDNVIINYGTLHSSASINTLINYGEIFATSITSSDGKVQFI